MGIYTPYNSDNIRLKQDAIVYKWPSSSCIDKQFLRWRNETVTKTTLAALDLMVLPKRYPNRSLMGYNMVGLILSRSTWANLNNYYICEGMRDSIAGCNQYDVHEEKIMSQLDILGVFKWNQGLGVRLFNCLVTCWPVCSSIY